MLLGVALAVCACVFFHMRVFNYDAIETIHSAWKISQGEKIYVDFDQPHHPGLYFFLAPIIAWSGDHLGTFQ